MVMAEHSRSRRPALGMSRRWSRARRRYTSLVVQRRVSAFAAAQRHYLMSRTPTLIFKCGLVASILIGMASIVGGIWAATRSPVLYLVGTGLPIGNKHLSLIHI